MGTEVSASHLVAVREAGTWLAGRWVVDHHERCTHRHQTIDAARACLSRWVNRHDGVVATGAWSRGGYGQILDVSSGQDVVIEVHRPPRFYERSGMSGRVSWTWTKWSNTDEHPEVGYPIEVRFACGAWEQRLMGVDSLTAAHVAGMALALSFFVERFGPESLVAMHLSMKKPGDGEEAAVVPAGRGLVIHGPWKTP